MAAADFAFTDEVDGPRHRLVLEGELDLLGADELEHAVAGLCGEGIEELVLDLRGVTFVDSTGLRAILSCWELAGASCHFAVVPGPRAVQRLFEVTGLLGRLPFAEPDGTPLQPGALRREGSRELDD